MQNWKKAIKPILFTVLLAALIVAGVFLFPGKLLPYDEVRFLSPKQSPYQGVLKVWQVNDWRVGSYSRTNLLQNAARRFEKANIGVFVEAENVTAEQFAQRLAAGEMPDVVSYPDGWAGIGISLLLPLDGGTMPPLVDPFRKVFSAEPRAVPWMAGGQLVLTNSEVGRAVGVEPPPADTTWNAAALLDYSGAAATGKRKKPYLAMAGAASFFESLALDGVSLAGLQEKNLLPDKAYRMGIDQARNVYTSGRCAVLLCSQWEAALMGRLAAKNKAFEYTVLPWPNGLRPCLSVQFVSVVRAEDDAKNTAATAFIASLLTKTVQKDIANKACCLPVVPLPDDAMPQGEIEKMLFVQLPIARVPLPLQARSVEDIEAAITGSREATARLQARFLD